MFDLGQYRVINTSGLGSRDIRSITIDPSNLQIVYASEEQGGVWKTADGGTSWAGPKNTGFSSGNPSIRSIVIDPTNISVVYAGDIYSGAYQSLDKGETWAPFPDSNMSGLSTRAITDLAISSDGSLIYVATKGEGVFYYGEIPLTPDIQANSSDGPVVIQTGENLSVTVSLNPGGKSDNADWWVYAISPFGTYWYTLDSDWQPSNTPIRVYGGPLFNITLYTILNMSTFPAGDYVFNFEVDAIWTTLRMAPMRIL